MWILAARRRRPLLKGVPREWRGMYTVGGASRNEDSAYNDFWYLFLDTYPPASPYPSKRGDSLWRCVGCSRNKDFWYLFSDTYPPALPYPSEEGTRGGGSSVDNGF